MNRTWPFTQNKAHSQTIMSDNITDKPDKFCRTQNILIFTPFTLVFGLSIHNVWPQEVGFCQTKRQF